MANKAGTALRYQVIYRALKEDISTGKYPVGSAFPTENEIAQRFHASRTTVRSALRLLHEGGYITSRQGSGSTVIADSSNLSPQIARYTDITDVDFTFSCDLPWNESGSESVVDSVFADDTVARELEIPVGTHVYRLQWRKSVNGVPFNFLTHYFRTDMFPDLPDKLPSRITSIYRIAEAEYGLTFLEAKEVVLPTCANFIQASFLNVREGTPLLKLCRTAQCQKGPMEYSETVLNPDLIRITFTIGEREE